MTQIRSIPVPNSIGQDVIILQKVLQSLGYNIKDDGIFGPKTTAAVSTEQKKIGLPGSGVMGPKSLKHFGLEVVPLNPVTNKEPITRDIKGKMDRHLHPVMRLMIENVVFVDGKIPQCFIDKDPQACFAFVAEKMAKLGIHEVGKNNHGYEVGLVQGVTGSYTENGNGDAWCNDWANCIIAIIEDYFQIESYIIGSASTMTTLAAAKKIPGLVTMTATAGTLALARHGKTSNGHAMPVIRVAHDSMITSEGNTSISNIRDGDGSGIKNRNTLKNGDLTTEGFLYLYPYGKLPTAA